MADSSDPTGPTDHQTTSQLRQRTSNTVSTIASQPTPASQDASSARQQQQQVQQQAQQQQQQASLRARVVAGAMGIGLVTAAVGGTYLLSENDAVFPFAVAACVATFSSVLLRFALTGFTADTTARTRVRHFRSHRHFTGERAAYVRTSQRLAMMDRDFTAADYEMLLDLDNNSQRLRRFLEGASQETVDRLPTYTYESKKVKKPSVEPLTKDILKEKIASGDSCEDEIMKEKEYAELQSAKEVEKSHQIDLSQTAEIAGATANSCTICLEDFEDGMKIRVLPCFHRFMAECIDPWLEQQAKCPICKERII